MKTIELRRQFSSNQGTFGLLFGTPGIRQLWIGELPWKDNCNQLSCIPAGTYHAEIHYSKKFGFVYWLRDVPNRAGIYMHNGNFVGDTTLGLACHSYGCLLFGKRVGILRGQMAVQTSVPARREFETAMNRQPFKLVITDPRSAQDA